MIRMSRLLSVALVALWLVGCSSSKSAIDSARFHLDKAEYDEAIALLKPIVDEDPQDFEAAGLLAGAYFGRGFLGQDGSYLGILSDYLEGQQAGKSNLESIADVTPAAAEQGKADIFAAEDVLEAIPAASRTQENYLQLGFTQLAIISVVGVAEVGALDSDDPCDYDFGAVNSAEEARFKGSLADVNGNFVNAGIDDFATTGLGEQLTNMKNDLDAATDLANYLETEFDAAACP